MGDLNAYGKEDPLLTLTDYSQEKYGRDIYTAAYTTIGGGELVMGDLNAYGKEDPLLTLTDYSKEKYGRDIYTAAYTTIEIGRASCRERC